MVALAVVCIVAFACVRCDEESSYPPIDVRVKNQTQGPIVINDQVLPVEVGDDIPIITFQEDEGLSKSFHINQNDFWLGDLTVKCKYAGEKGPGRGEVKVMVTLTEPTPGQLVATSDDQKYTTASYGSTSVEWVQIDGLNNSSDTIGFWDETRMIAAGSKGLIESLLQNDTAHIRVWRNNIQGNPVTLGTLNLTAAPYFTPQVGSDSSWVRSLFTIDEPTSGHLYFTLTQPYPYISFTYADSVH